MIERYALRTTHYAHGIRRFNRTRLGDHLALVLQYGRVALAGPYGAAERRAPTLGHMDSRRRADPGRDVLRRPLGGGQPYARPARARHRVLVARELAAGGRRAVHVVPDDGLVHR